MCEGVRSGLAQHSGGLTPATVQLDHTRHAGVCEKITHTLENDRSVARPLNIFVSTIKAHYKKIKIKFLITTSNVATLTIIRFK